MDTSFVDLCSAHFAEITADSSVNPDVAADRGYRTLYGTPEDRAELASMGFTPSVFGRDDAFPALLIPMYRATGEVICHQVKPAHPRTRINGDGRPKPIKYETPKGSSVHVDVPRFTRERLSDLSVPLWITEGIKKTDALVSKGRAAIGLTGVFNWRRKLGTLGDWEDIPLKGREVVICFDADARENRNVLLAMTRLGAWLESKGVRAVQYLIVPAEASGVPVKGVDDFFCAGGTLEALREAATRTAPTSGSKDASMTDAVLTDTVCEEALEGRFVWAAGLGWLAWNGYVWEEVAEIRPIEAIRQWVIDKFQSVLAEQSKNPSKDLDTQLGEWRAVMSRNRINALAALSRGNLERDAAEFDSDPDVLCVRNGFVDLRTGKLHDPDPDKMMTKCAGVDYVPGASHTDWDASLEALPQDTRDWYRLRVGQAATGHMTPDDLMIIAHGDGSNGKTTLNEGVQKALGTYAILVSDRMLMASSDAHPTELMDLRGARYAMLEETAEARRLDTQRLKKTVGTERITARRIRQDDVTFPATHSLFINTNFKPVVSETDRGTWRRLALLPFPYTFKRSAEDVSGPLDRVGDPTIRQRVKADQNVKRAVLAWIVAGARDWYARGQVMPEHPQSVVEATTRWRAETDLILGFATEMLRFTDTGRVSAKDMLAAFNGWGEDQGHRMWTDTTFSARFKAHELIKLNKVEKKRVRPGGKSTQPTTMWVGVTLREEGDGGQEKGPFGDPDKPGHVETDILGGVQGVQGRSDKSLRVEQLMFTGTDCTPCTPSVHPRSEGVCDKPDTEGLPANRTPPSEEGPLAASVGAESGDVPDSVTAGDGIFGLDLEAGSIDRLFSSDPGTYLKLYGHGDRVDTSPEALLARLRAGGVAVGHNVLGFDMVALERDAGLQLEETYGRIRDTQLQAMLADPPTSAQTKPGPNFKSYSLDAVAQRVLGRTKDERGKMLVAEYCSVPGCRHGSASKACDGWDRIDPQDPRYASYCADDVALGLEIHRALPWSPYMEREMRVQTIMARMRLNGFRVNEDLLATRIREGEERKAAAVSELETRYGMPTGSKSPLSTKVGKEWLRGIYERFGVRKPPLTRKGALATSTDVLRTLAEHPECPAELKHVIETMGVITSARTVYGTIADHTLNGRVHPEIWPRQASGRWSVTKPGLTVVGKRGALATERGVFLPDPGERIVCFDLGQADMRVLAAHSQDPAYIELFGPGRDAHTEIAISIFGSAEFRSKAKPIGHGVNYGMQEARLIADGNDPELVRTYFRMRAEKFPRLVEWTEEVREQGSAGELLDNGFGRPMRVDPDHSFTQSPAQIGQGGTRDMIAEGLLDIADRAPEVLPMLRAVVHDELVLSIPEKDTEEVSRVVVDCLQRDWCPPGASIPVHFPADCTSPGVNWADAYQK